MVPISIYLGCMSFFSNFNLKLILNLISFKPNINFSCIWFTESCESISKKIKKVLTWFVKSKEEAVYSLKEPLIGTKNMSLEKEKKIDERIPL